MSAKNVLMATLAGVATGLAIGILFAPDKGEVTRKKLALKKDEILDDLSGKFNDLVDDITELKEKVADEVEELKKKGENVIHDLKS